MQCLSQKELARPGHPNALLTLSDVSSKTRVCTCDSRCPPRGRISPCRSSNSNSTTITDSALPKHAWLLAEQRLNSIMNAVRSSAFRGVGGAKRLQREQLHLEFHRGRPYLQVGVPSCGPPLLPGSVVTKPVGDIRGNGAFATQLIPAGTHIGDYTGELLCNKTFFQRYPDGVGNYAMAIDGDTVIDAAASVDATDSFHPVHMNHSRTRANVVRFYQRSQARVAFFAARDIQEGEELLFDYGRAYWRGREHMELQ